MKKLLFLLCAATALFAADGPEYTSDGQLMRPVDYREWIYLSSGIGMTYGPLRSSAPEENPPFDNVFVSPTAYRTFVKTGKWPNKTVLVLEVRASQSKGSINQGGHFQGPVLGIETHVKDNDQWAFYGFRGGVNASKIVPRTASCYTCHDTNGAVDSTFVQFYPSLIAYAKEKGTYKLAKSEEPAVSTVTDVVCGMTIDPRNAAAKSEYKGKTYYFDDRQCKASFDESPEKYLKPKT